MIPMSPPQAPFSLVLSLQARSVPEARRRAAGQAALWGLPALAEDVALITTELFTNAVLHAPGGGSATISLVLQVDTGHLRIEVTGPASGGVLPAVTTMPGPDAISGRGLPIVAALAASRGSRRHGGELAVWATVPFTNCPGERAA